MKVQLTCLSVAALIVTAACSRQDAAEANAPFESTESNVVESLDQDQGTENIQGANPAPSETESSLNGSEGRAVQPAGSGNDSLATTAADPAQIAHDRHENFEQIGKAAKGISDALKADAPSVETIRAHAATIARFAPEIINWFPVNSGPERGFETEAKQEIWDNPSDFRELWRNFSASSTRFSAAAEQGDVEAIHSAFSSLRKSCKDCHDRFRESD